MKAKVVMRQFLSVLLVLCIIMGMVPTMAAAAEEVIPPNEDTFNLQQAIRNLPEEGGVVQVEKPITLTHTLVIPAGKKITLSGGLDDNGELYTITADKNFQGGELIKIEDGTDTTVNIDRLILNGNEKCRGIYLGAHAKLYLGGSVMPGEGHRLVIQNCYTLGTVPLSHFFPRRGCLRWGIMLLWG